VPFFRSKSRRPHDNVDTEPTYFSSLNEGACPIHRLLILVIWLLSLPCRTPWITWAVC